MEAVDRSKARLPMQVELVLLLHMMLQILIQQTITCLTGLNKEKKSVEMSYGRVPKTQKQIRKYSLITAMLFPFVEKIAVRHNLERVYCLSLQFLSYTDERQSRLVKTTIRAE